MASDLTNKINNQKVAKKIREDDLNRRQSSQNLLLEQIKESTEKYTKEFKDLLIDNYCLVLGLNTSFDEFCEEIGSIGMGNIDKDKDLQHSRHSNNLSHFLNFRLGLKMIELIKDEKDPDVLYHSFLNFLFGIVEKSNKAPENQVKELQKTVIDFLKDFNILLSEKLGNGIIQKGK